MNMGIRSRWLVVCTAVALSPASSAQVTVAWSSPYTAQPLPSTFRSLCVDALGRSFVAGDTPATFPPQPGQPYFADAHLACLDAQGALLWERTYRVPGQITNIFLDVAVDAGGRSVAIETRAVVSYDSAGTFLWQAAPSTGAANLVKVVLDAAGNAYVIGNVPVNLPTTNTDMIFVKYSPSGNVLATGGFAGATNHFDTAWDAALDALGNLYVTGRADAFGSPGDFVLIKLDAALNQLWTYTTAAGTPPETYVACGPSGEAYVAGIANFRVARFDPNGVLAWMHAIPDATHPVGRVGGIVVDPQGNVVVAGLWGGQSEGVLRKYDPAGNELWTRTIAAPGQASMDQIDVDEGGDLVVGGRLGFYPTPGATDFVARFDRDGHQAWLFPFGVGIGGLRDTVHVGPGMSTYWVYSSVRRLESNVVPLCFGDGSGTPCPCGNASPMSDRSGCTHSFGSAGRLGHDGFASLANDTVVLVGTQMTNSSALYFQGTTAAAGGAGLVFGDGLRCVTGPVNRLSTKTNVGGESQFPAAGDNSVSATGGVAAPGVRLYQVLYRNQAPFCTSDTFNLTNALRVTWTP